MKGVSSEGFLERLNRKEVLESFLVQVFLKQVAKKKEVLESFLVQVFLKQVAKKKEVLWRKNE